MEFVLYSKTSEFLTLNLKFNVNNNDEYLCQKFINMNISIYKFKQLFL